MKPAFRSLALIAPSLLAFAALAAASPASAHTNPTAGSPAISGLGQLKNGNSHLCMGTTTGAVYVGTKVVQTDCLGNHAQTWSWIQDSGYHPIVNQTKDVGESRCLAVPGHVTIPIQLILYSCNNKPDQNWKINASGGGIVLINQNSGLVVGVAGGVLTPDAAVVQTPYTYHPDQYWNVH